MNHEQLKVATKYLLRAGLVISLVMPPYIVYWKHQQMERMGNGVKTDIERVKSKEKTLTDIPRYYYRNDAGREYRDRLKHKKNKYEDINFEKEYNEQ